MGYVIKVQRAGDRHAVPRRQHNFSREAADRSGRRHHDDLVQDLSNLASRQNQHPGDACPEPERCTSGSPPGSPNFLPTLCIPPERIQVIREFVGTWRDGAVRGGIAFGRRTNQANQARALRQSQVLDQRENVIGGQRLDHRRQCYQARGHSASPQSKTSVRSWARKTSVRNL